MPARSGDEVLVAEPMYVTYEGVFGACGAKVVPVPVRSQNGFRVDPADVAALITPNTRAMLLNSPNNLRRQPAADDPESAGRVVHSP